MPLRIELRDPSGTTIGVTGEVYDTLDATLPDVDFAEYPLLAGIDRYGETMFNQIQLGRLAIELAQLRKAAPPRRARLIDELVALCHRGAEISQAELWILGD